MPKIKDDPWIDSEIISDHFFKEIKSFIEQVHEGKTGIISWLFFCKYFRDFQLTGKPLHLALAIKEQPCVLDHPTVRYQIIAWTLQSKYPYPEDKINIQQFAEGLAANIPKKRKRKLPFSNEHVVGTYKYIYKMLSEVKKDLKPKDDRERNFALRTLFNPSKAKIIPLESKISEWCKITKLRELALTITQYFLSYKWSLEYKNDFVKDKDKLLVPPKLIPKKWIEKKVYEK
ncbi:MAG: hypothetical protein VX618_04380 [Thermodesulfobacteriota bacterium]|nr:hypothetical protein [bacterium]MEC7925712.1 hypothetical protein [Thermodesulfobacteriota bacterium]NSW95990.1 hypothetical protein [bacterium]|tara:strand:+ start:1307 stop:1999 length:693 start_codon:yes stop_codon:yes gene_type:complete